MSRTPYVRAKKEFLQEIVEPEVQSEQIELQEINWDDLTERQREEIIQKERLKDVRPEKRPV
jgi:hypothetical protein